MSSSVQLLTFLTAILCFVHVCTADGQYCYVAADITIRWCDNGCCGDSWDDYRCCTFTDLYLGAIIGGTIGVILLISGVVLLVICLKMQNKNRGRIGVVNSQPGTTVTHTYPAGTYPQHQGYAPQPQGYAPQPQGYAPQPPGYAPQPQGYGPPPGYSGGAVYPPPVQQQGSAFPGTAGPDPTAPAPDGKLYNQ